MIKFADVNTFIGFPSRKIYGALQDSGELLARMKASGIDKAAVWHVSQQDFSPPEGNRILAESIRGAKKQLYGTWTILPPQTEEVISGNFFQKMKQDGVYFLRAFPVPHNFILDKVVFGNFFEETAERGIPLLLSLERGITWEMIYKILSDYPKLTCIICDIGVWGQSRRIWPLLEKYSNVYIESSLLSIGEFQLESTVKKFGAEKVIFGSGFPIRAHEPAMLQLSHAEISDDDKAKIASGNFENLIGRIKL